MFSCRKILPYLVSIATVFFLAFPVFGAEPTGSSVLYDNAMVSQWNIWWDNNVGVALSVDDAAVETRVVMWDMLDKASSRCGYGSCASFDDLENAASAWNSAVRSVSTLKEYVAFLFSTGHFNRFSVEPYYDEAFGVWRLRERITGLLVVNSAGAFPYYRPASEEEVEDPSKAMSYVWMTTDQVDWYGTFDLRSYSSLTALAKMYDGSVIAQRGEFNHISNNLVGMTVWLCTPDGSPLSAIAELPSTGIGTSNNYYTEEGDTSYNQLIDVDNNTVWFPDGTLQYIDNLTYDASTQTYYVDAHDEYTWNSTTNNYEFNSYSYTYQYHIDYTSVTYIGTTQEYDETYEFYYQLPDGRSSADLTAEDLEQLSLVFHDVVNYARSADDVNQRVLYHFDGNVEDSSYWSYASSFSWKKGASLTYMDEGTFGGSLYLDETEHQFTINLPGNDAAADWTLQFRYYQSHTAAPAQDSYLAVGENTLLQFTGAQYLNKAGSLICATSVGTWNELCLMRQAGTVYIYVNGVYYGSEACDYSQPTITFHFGSEQQTFKKLDELRFTKGAVYTPGENYTPSSVPYDSNLTLILPDGEIPVADEVMVFVPSTDNLLIDTGMADWTSADVITGLKANTAIGFSDLVGHYMSSYTSFSYGNGAVSFFSGTAAPGMSGFTDGLFFPISTGALTVGNTYCFSVVLADGSSSSLVFTAQLAANPVKVVSTLNNSSVVLSSPSVNVGSGMMATTLYGIMAHPAAGTTPQIMHMELVEGTEPSWSLRWDAAVYSSGQLTESPVLAVRTNLPVSVYQIGGVRPSYPVKGQVWAMVEGGRMTSLQQYSGYAWQEVDGRIWTGSRWIPYSSYDVFTMQDFWDTVGTTPDYEYIYTETGFWSWWQKKWNGFTEGIQTRHEELLEAIKDIDGGTDIDIGDIFVDVDATINEDGTENDDGWSFLDLMGAVKDGVWGFIKGMVGASFDGFGSLVEDFKNVGSFFDYFDPESGEGIFVTDGESEVDSIWD